MKTCPYCAEQIQDDAIRCRYCGTMLGSTAVPSEPGATTPPDATSAPAPTIPPGPPRLPSAPRAEDEALQYSHSGQRFLLGYGIDFFGIWDRLQPGGPVRRFPRTDEGWRQAWSAYVFLEPYRAEVGMGSSAASTPEVPSWEQVARGAPPVRRVNGAWWLLPILLGWLGGLIAWLVNKEADPRTARAMLIVGIAISLVGAVLVALAIPSLDVR